MSVLRKLIFFTAAVSALEVGRLSASERNALPVIVTIENAAGQPVDDAYVALVPPDRPWSRPEVEKIATRTTVTLEVPEGEYRIVAAAPGKGAETSDRVRVLASQKNEFRVVLRGVRTITGTIRGEDGQPLPDVAIGDVNAFVEAPLGSLSELAAGHLGSDWRTTSREDGTWSLVLPSGRSNPIVAQSPGFATAWRTRKEGDTAPVELVTTRAGTLRLTFDRAAPEFAVTLTAKDESVSMPGPWQAQLRARRVRTPSVEWTSLAPGEYDVYAQQSDPRTFSHAVKLGTVTLEGGATRELRMQLAPAKSAPKSLARVLVRPVPGLDAEKIESFGRDATGAPRAVPTVAERVSGGTLLYLDTTGFAAPYFGTASDYRFVVMPVRDDESFAVASVVDRGGASLHVRTAGDSVAPPTAGVATFHGCSTPESIAVPVAVSKGNAVKFAAPAGCTGFVLDFEPFSPLVLPKQLAVGDAEWLGEFTLYAAGTAAVRVATEDGSPVAGAIVSVSARTEGGLQAAVPIAEKSAGPDGWARFDRLPAGGELAISARTAEGDRSVIETARTEPAHETVIDPLRMPKPATLIVEPKLAPSFVEQFPGASIQSLFLERLDGKAEPRNEHVAGHDAVEFRRLLPGRWQIGALVTSGRGLQPVWGEQIEVEAGEPRRVEALFNPLVFRGRVSGSIGDLSGNIDILGPLRSDPVPSVELSAAGEFIAVLPRRDTYFVGVRLRKTGQMLWVGNTAFVDPAQPIELKLPQGSIVASVSENGRPVAGATVMARMQHQPTADVPLIALPVKTGTDGRARLEGLLPGQWVVFVTGDRQDQANVTVTSSDPAHVQLEITKGLAITGSVSETFGAPVSGARLTCLLPGPDGLPYLRVAFTAADGTFDMEGRAMSRAPVLCSVTSFSGAQGFRVVPGEHARLFLPANPATLHVARLPTLERFSGLWLVSRDGRLIEASPYVSRLPGAAALTIPALAPDAWKLVSVSKPAEWLALTSGVGMLPAIADVTLKPNERKVVKLGTAGRGDAPGRR